MEFLGCVSDVRCKVVGCALRNDSDFDNGYGYVYGVWRVAFFFFVRGFLVTGVIKPFTIQNNNALGV